MPSFSSHFVSIKPSALRMAQIVFAKRTDDTIAINTAIGNVSLPMHPAMQERMFNLDSEDSPFKNGVVRYTSTKGFKETNDAFLNIIAASGFNTDNLYTQITNGGSQAMELTIVGVCGEPGTNDSPLLLIDAAYTNYHSIATRLGRKTVSVTRNLKDDGTFELPSIEEIEKTIKEHKPNALLIIPYDNPTGHFYPQETINDLAKICVENDMWLISDEAYRELYYTDGKASSVWGITEEEVPGITGRRVSIESASKVWNGCGLRIGAIITDNEDFSTKAQNENTIELCSPAISQYIFGALAKLSHNELHEWFHKQREYYRGINKNLHEGLSRELPDLIISKPEASIYAVVDVRNIDPDFDSTDFVTYCATHGTIKLDDGKNYTLLVSPMPGFYSVKSGIHNPGLTQMRIAFVESAENMKKVPILFSQLLQEYLNKDK